MMKFRRHLWKAQLCLVAVCVTGCTAVGTVSTIANVANAALEVSGIKKPATPEVTDAFKVARSVSIRLHAADALNMDTAGRSSALVIRIYKLRQGATFQQVPYETFLTPQREKEALGADLLEVKEVTLIPGQHYDIVEKVSREAYFIGVVALLRNPAPLNWRVAFAADKAEQSGITLGFHRCSLSVGSGATNVDGKAISNYLSPVRCP